MPQCITCGAPAAILDPRRGEPVCLLHTSTLDERDQETMAALLRAMDQPQSDPNEPTVKADPPAEQ